MWSGVTDFLIGTADSRAGAIVSVGEPPTSAKAWEILLMTPGASPTVTVCDLKYEAAMRVVSLARSRFATSLDVFALQVIDRQFDYVNLV